MRPILFILSIIMILPFFYIPMAIEEVVIGEQPCVDGNQNINLDGIMCEKTDFRVNGISTIYLALPAVIIFISGVILLFISLLTSKNDALSQETEVKKE